TTPRNTVRLFGSCCATGYALIVNLKYSPSPVLWGFCLPEYFSGSPFFLFSTAVRRFWFLFNLYSNCIQF
ncbi:MAG: hypothetical protein IKG79_05820, partial [Neisseriaceae bacterium]|nr:hypothetical protein [Neisseriaceae bacterium]